MTNVADFFRDYAPRYDEFAIHAMPRYQEMLGEIVRCLPEGAAEILELGCGTGSLTVLLARKYPDGRITATDASAEMIELAQARLGSSAVPRNQVALVQSLFERMELPKSAYDLLASNMSLHHVADKAPFYGLLYESLHPGGLFVLGDELAGGLPHVQQLNWDGWLRFARHSGGLTEAEIDDVIEHERGYDHYETLTRQLELLSEAGFGPVDCVWRYLNYAVFVAKK